MISNAFRTTVFSRSALAVAAFSCLTAAAAQAQQSPASPSTTVNAPTLFASASTHPMDLANLAGVNYSSSTSDGDSSSLATPVGTERLNFSDESAMQPPPRRYGRPRYNDSSHNADGSNKWTFEGAAGLALPVGDTHDYFNPSWAFSVGGGRQFNNKFAVLLQFDYDHFGINKATLDNQTALYVNAPPTTICTPAIAPAGGCGVIVDGNNHVWSFTLNPTYTFLHGDKYGAYAVVGAGFYHKVTNFTTPETEEIYYYGFPESYTANQVFDHYSSNAAGFNGGFGLTYKFSRFAGERFFIEARYVFMDNSQRQGYTYANENTAVLTGSSANDFFPANSNRTTYIPIKVGIRF